MPWHDQSNGREREFGEPPTTINRPSVVESRLATLFGQIRQSIRLRAWGDFRYNPAPFGSARPKWRR